LEPGDESEISFTTHMMEGMDGPHTFEVTVQSNDVEESTQKLVVKGQFGP